MGTTVEEVFYRLADYEDTGLTPEEVMRMMKTMREVGMELMRLDRSRWKDQYYCPLCDPEYPPGCDTCSHAAKRAELEPCKSCAKRYADTEGEGSPGYVPANYCSNCGRPLTEQAWAELEMRVYGGSPAAAARRETQMIKPLEQDFCVEDETGRTDAKIVEKINEIIKAMNEITERKQENGYG